jgi:hypothetical protein
MTGLFGGVFDLILDWALTGLFGGEFGLIGV